MLTLTVLASALAVSVVATVIPVVQERAACNKYVIISTRGTSEPQGASEAFTTCISAAFANLSGGVEYDTVYPASVDQISSVATTDILNRITTGLQDCPNQKYALLGYSQGASATVNALKKLTPTSGNGVAVAAVFLVGDPEHLPNKLSNRDQNGGNSTSGEFGLEGLIAGGGIPTAWDHSGRVLDVCYQGDIVCGGTQTAPHSKYGSTASVQTQCSNLLLSKLG